MWGEVGWEMAVPVESIPGGLTCVGLKGWQHGYKHIVQEERAAVHPDGARQQPAEVADIAGGRVPRRASASSRGRLTLTPVQTYQTLGDLERSSKLQGGKLGSSYKTFLTSFCCTFLTDHIFS